MSEKQAPGWEKKIRKDLDLSDILDMSELQPIFDDFYRIAPVPMSILDLQGRVLVGIGWQDICTCFHRVNPESRNNCLQSDLEITRNVEPGKYLLYKCKNNMWDVATPIYAGEKKVGNLFMGNFFFDDDEIDYGLFREQARRFGFDEDEYLAALDRVPRISHETVDLAMSFFMKLGRYLSDQGMTNLKLAHSLEQNRSLIDDLVSSREMFDLFLNSTTEIAFLKNAELRYEMVNEAYLEFLRKPRDEVTGRTDSELMPRDLAEQCLRSDEDIIRSGKPAVTQEFEKGRVFESRKFPVSFNDGTVGVGGFIREVTDLWKAEASNKESEERFRSIFDNATIGLYRTSPDGNIQMANPTLVKMLGYSTFEELAGRDLNKEGFEPDYQRRTFMEKIESEGEIIGLEAAWTRKDGTVLFVRESARPFRGPEGNILFYEGTVEDITERKKTLEALKDSEERFRSVFENTSIGLYRTTPGGKILMANPALLKMHGYSTFEELAERDLNKDGYGPDYQRRTFMEKMESEGEIIGLEAAWTRKNGTVFFVRESARTFRDPDGNVLFYEGTVEDITERRIAEDLHRKSEEKYRTLVETASDIVFTMTEGGVFIFVSPAWTRILGHETSDVEGHSFRSFVHPEDLHICLEALERSVKTGTAQAGVQYRIIHKDGTWRWQTTNTSPVRDPAGKIISYMGIARDITEWKKADEALLKSEALLRISGKLASLGGWSIDIPGDRVTWSDEVAAIHEMPAGFSPTLEEAKSFYAPEYGERISKVFGDCVKYGKPYDEEVELITKSGRRIWGHEIGEASRDESGKIVQAWGAFQDITSRKNTEDTLRLNEDKLRRAFQTTIEVLTQAVERRDPYTAGHQKRVAALAGEIAVEIGLSPERVEGIKMAGFVHDIGKISVPSEILSKPGKLSGIEMNIIREHSVNGRDILKDVETAWPLDEIVYQHHERIDGSGYPRGLKGDDILIEARILCVADVVEAMASHRPYRPTLGIEAALDEIEKKKGTLYDPQVVDACLDLFREKGYSLIE